MCTRATARACVYTCRFVGGGGGAAAEGWEEEGAERGERASAEGDGRGSWRTTSVGYARGVGDTSVCISAAKLPFEAGGKEDTGEKRGRPEGREGEKEERVLEEKEREEREIDG